MPSAMPRIQCHVMPATKAGLHQMSVEKGMTYGQIIDVAIAQYAIDRKSWVAHQAGYQTLLGTAVMPGIGAQELDPGRTQRRA